MRQRGERKDLADHRGDLRSRDAGAADHDIGSDIALIGANTGHLVAGRQHVQYLVTLENRCTPCRRTLELGGYGTDGLGDAVVGDEQATVYRAGIEQVPRLDRLLGIEQSGARNSPGLGITESALQLGGPRRRGGYLQSTDRQIAGIALVGQSFELLDGVSGEVAHHLGAVGLEHDAGGVRCRTSRDRQRAAVYDGDVGPAAVGQLVGKARSDDAAADDHDGWLRSRTWFHRYSRSVSRN